MPDQPPPETPEPAIELKDPLLAGFLAWLVPGLGHAYQGRYAKAVLIFVCIMGTFIYGLYLGSNPDIGWGRVVYVSFRQNDMRLPYLCQVGVGLPALPAMVQAYRVWDGKPPLGRFMAPPELKPPRDDPTGTPSAWELYDHGPRLFEFGTVYTMIAGLLNVLAVYDACCGPVPPQPAKKEDEEDEADK